MQRLRQNTTGFTLIELLLYTAIVGSLLIAIVGFYGMASSARIKNQSISEVNQQGIAAMDMITQAIRNSTGVTTPAAAATGPTLVLTMPVSGVSPTTFSLNGTTLQIAEGSGAAVALTNSKVQVTSLSFKNLARSGSITNVQVTMTLARASSSALNEYSYQKTFTASAEVQW